MINQLVRKQILEIKEINWGDVPSEQAARLLWGENPIAPQEAILAVKREAKKINYYPSPTKIEFRESLAKYNDVLPRNVILTNGSDEAIELIAKVFISENDEVIIPVPTFPVYESASLMMGAKVKLVTLDKDFSLDTKKLLALVNPKTKILWLANPNNPTGNILLTKAQIQELANKINCLLVVDECYFELARVTATDLVNKYPNIVIIRSFSKVFGLAGARLGYIIANQLVISYLNRLQQTNQVFSVNRFAQAAAQSIIEDRNRIQELVRDYENQKRNFEKLLSQIKSVQVVQTKTTFCLLNLKGSGVTAAELKTELQKANIYIKDCSMYQLLGPEYVYVGVPSKTYLKQVIQTIQKIIEKKNIIDGIIFDLDGVLINTRKSYRKAVKKSVQYILKTDFGISREINDSDIDQIKRVPGFNNEWDTSTILIKLISAKLPKNQWSKRVGSIGPAKRTTRLFKRVLDIFQNLYLGSSLYGQLYKKTAPLAVAGLINNESLLINKALIRKLKKEGYKLAIATGRPRFEALYALRKNGLIPEFFRGKSIVALEDAKAEKPNPALLFKAKEVIGAKNPMYVGDTVNDILAAKGANMKSIFIGKEKLGDYKIDNINNLFEFLEAYL